MRPTSGAGIISLTLTCLDSGGGGGARQTAPDGDSGNTGNHRRTCGASPLATFSIETGVARSNH
jgi:hypothetical protein